MTTDTKTLFPILANQRVYKTAKELELMKHVSKVTSLSHVNTMRTIKPGMMEYQAEATFLHFNYFHYGCRQLAYTAICACGPDPAVLHYGHAGAPNDQKINDGDMCLMDMGAEYHCYCSDITMSWPANGTFTDVQKIVYEGVLNAQRNVFEILRPGTSWVDCHRAAEKAILTAMVKLGVIRMVDGVTMDDMVELRLGGIFMPHGLGHFIGVDTHDVGGYLPDFPKRESGPGLKSLRTARILEKDMCLTVEPGCYFIDYTIDNALKDDKLKGFIVEAEVNKHRGTGGVRLEDVIAITEENFTNYTVAPRGIDEVESVMAGNKWPPVKDLYPELKRETLLTM